jgi:hypothetical protein
LCEEKVLAGKKSMRIDGVRIPGCLPCFQSTSIA